MTVEMKVPDVGESVSEVYIGEWLKAEGDIVALDEELVEVESDKATFDAPSPAAGILKEIRKQSGETAKVGEVIAIIDDSSATDNEAEQAEQDANVAADDSSEGSETVDEQEGDRSEESSEERGEQAETAREDTDSGEEDRQTGDSDEQAALPPRVMPSVMRLLAEHDLCPDDVPATGPDGHITEDDVKRHLEQLPTESEAKPSPATSSDNAGRREERVTMNPIRRRIAQRLVESQQTAALLTTFNEIDMSAVKELRQSHGQAFENKYNIRLGYMSFFVKAVIDGLKQCPELNAEIQENEVVYRDYFDIGVAIGTERGLVVPVIRNAELLSFAEVEQQIDELAVRARQGELKVEQLQGGTFTISNGGIYGSLLSTPLVNPPQSGVLGMHAIQERPIVVDGEIVIRPMMYVALTYDHRLIDGREAVTFLRRVKEAIEQPARMLIEV